MLAGGARGAAGVAAGAGAGAGVGAASATLSKCSGMPYIRFQHHSQARMTPITHTHEVLNSSIWVVITSSQRPHDLLTLETHLHHILNCLLEFLPG